MLVIIIGMKIISSALRILQFARVDLMYRPSSMACNVLWYCTILCRIFDHLKLAKLRL